MKMQKKLKRGLADLSNFFAQPQVVEQARKASLLAIEPPQAVSQPLLKPSLVTASILSFSPSFNLSEMVDLTEAIKGSFSGVHFVTLSGSEHSLEYSIPSKDINYEKISWHQLEPLVEPQRWTNSIPGRASPSEKALAILDSGLYGLNSSDATLQTSLFELLDHCVFVVEPHTKQLMNVYQWMKKILSRNPNIHYSLFLAGNGAEHFSEFIYERLNKIISNFLGHNLGFLGWMEDEKICMNPDLLKNEADSAFIHHSKIHLSDLLDSTQFISV